MATVGERALLKILREERQGIYLFAGEELGEVLLPRKEVPREWEVGGLLEVFLYRDSEDRPVATIREPRVMPGGFGYLEVVALTEVGAFMDWGLAKDLLLPFREQKERMVVGKKYVVHVHIDERNGRIVASRRLSRYLDKTPARYVEGEEVELRIFGKTDLGYKAIVNDVHTGVLFENQVFRRLRAGEVTKGYIVQVRPDGKIDLSLYAYGREGTEALEKRIDIELEKRGGFWALCDSSSPEEIQDALGVSKKAFKKALGALFKKRRIVIEEGGIRRA